VDAVFSFSFVLFSDGCIAGLNFSFLTGREFVTVEARDAAPVFFVECTGLNRAMPVPDRTTRIIAER